MKKAVIIACAGWKGAGRGTEFVHLPAPFLPLGDGTTCAGRLSAFFRGLGFDVALVVGTLGYPFRSYQPRHKDRLAGKTGKEVAMGVGVDPAASPWTPLLFSEVIELGELIVVSDPGWQTKHDSFCEGLDRWGKNYDHVALVRGDKLYDEAFLGHLLETLPWPCQFQFDVYHSLFLLDQAAARAYRMVAQGQRRRSGARLNWGQEMSKQPDGGEGTGRLVQVGIPHLGWHTSPWDTVGRENLWHDVDVRYQETVEWLRRRRE